MGRCPAGEIAQISDTLDESLLRERKEITVPLVVKIVKMLAVRRSADSKVISSMSVGVKYKFYNLM